VPGYDSLRESQLEGTGSGIQQKEKCFSALIRLMAQLPVAAIFGFNPIDIDGVADQPQLAAGTGNLGAKPMAAPVARPGQRDRLLRGKDIGIGGRSYFQAVFDL
jgi:hypothetical protein